MSVRRLREAAKVLREKTAAATPGPWESEPVALLHRVSGEIYELPHENCEYPQFARHEDATYIATMHPGVGLALADWLDDEAGRIELAIADGGDTRPWEPSVRIADLILGGEPS